MEELLLKINKMNDKQKEYMLFLTLYKMNDPEKMSKTYEELGEKFGVRNEIVRNLYLMALFCDDFGEYIDFITKIDELNLADQNYKEILIKTKQLANELKLGNSLELANLFTYLLWNGYFSKNKSLEFQSDGRMMIGNHYALDIMNGIGVCLNFSYMLTDFINQFDYSAATVINTFDVKQKPNYSPTIERNVAKSSDNIWKMLLSKVLVPVAKRTGNHAFNLINDKGNLYIYDATNLMMFNLNDKFNCSSVCGVGGARIKPYFSHFLNSSEKSLLTLIDLNMKTEFLSPYTRKDFIFTWENCYENFVVNQYLLGCFHDEIKDNIGFINSSAKDVKRLIKERENKYRSIRNK